MIIQMNNIIRVSKKLTTFCFLLIISWAYAESSQNRSLLIHQKMELTLSDACFFDNLAPVIVFDELKEIIYETLLINETMSMVFIDKNFKASDYQKLSFSKWPTYVLSSNQLQTILREMKSSSWWNIDSRFLIVETSNESCNNAWNTLQLMWKNNLLSSVFICQYSDNSVALYTYNPYVNYAPYSWQKVKNPVNEQDSQWTLYKRLNSQDGPDCDNLFFDKTKYLNGHNVIGDGLVRSGVSSESGKAYNISSLSDKLLYYNSKVFLEIFRSLNVTPTIYYTSLIDLVKTGNRTSDILYKNLVDNTHDIFLTIVVFTNANSNLNFLYPRHVENLLIVTRPQRVLSFFEEAGSICSTEVIVLTVLIFLITLIVLMICKRLDFVSGLLEILRLLLSISMESQFYRYSLKIYFTFVLFFVMVINNEYQGRMSAYSTKIQHDVVNSITDLQNLKYSIYMATYLREIVGVDDWTDEQKKYVHYSNDDCYKFVIDDDEFRTACVGYVGRNLAAAIKHDLHVVLDNNQKFASCRVRRDWPLKTKIDKILTKLTDSGLLKYWKDIQITNPIQRHKIKEIEMWDSYREIVPSDLYYIFLLWAVCLLTSAIIFIFEIFSDRLSSYTS
ncbi:uncharacterized protein LOC130670072 [Microplitis mediator]|uniref:uncharacterized protein LOC130670072 n=1 Tax=Microplitis mediator TaxID=375433 RepID=UPI002556DC00|nr:uncharacterized protein LOC130670072 [Microplitis mediator]